VINTATKERKNIESISGIWSLPERKITFSTSTRVRR